jgi:hypothetical protein
MDARAETGMPPPHHRPARRRLPCHAMRDLVVVGWSSRGRTPRAVTPVWWVFGDLAEAEDEDLGCDQASYLYRKSGI